MTDFGLLAMSFVPALIGVTSYFIFKPKLKNGNHDFLIINPENNKAIHVEANKDWTEEDVARIVSKENELK